MSALSSHVDATASTVDGTFVATSVSHPRLLRIDAESIRRFLQLYDHYTREVVSRAQQLTAGGITTEAVSLVNLKFCVDPEIIESALALGSIPDYSDYGTLTDAALLIYLEGKSQESKDSVNLDTLDNLVRTQLRMDMTDKNAKSRMEAFFMSYHKMLRMNGLAWLIKSNQRVSVYHVLSAIRPRTLQDRLDSDLQFAYHDCRKDFVKFMTHCIRVSEAFQLVDSGISRKRNENNSGKPKRGGNPDKGKPNSDKADHGKGRSSRNPPFCPHRPCKSKGSRH